MLTDDELTERLARRMLSAASPAGRLRLRLYVAWKRIAWRFTISFTSFVKRAIDLGRVVCVTRRAPDGARDAERRA